MGYLTGPAIRRAVDCGDIEIDPFDPSCVGPDSVDLHFGPELFEYKYNLWTGSQVGTPTIDSHNPPEIVAVLPRLDGGFCLQPGHPYLGATQESIYARCYKPVIDCRSRTARMFLHAHVTAGLLPHGFRGKVTLEMYTVHHAVIIYPGQALFQAAFATLDGDLSPYDGVYQGQSGVRGAVGTRDSR